MAHVKKLPNGRYKARWRAPDGTTRSKTFLLSRDAKAYLDTVGHSQQVGTYVDPGKGKILFGDFVANLFIPMMKSAPSTKAQNESYLRSLILPTFATYQLAAIDYETCQAWVNKLERIGKSPETVHKAVQILGRIFKAAIKGGRITTNPVAEVEMTPIGDHEAMFLDSSQVITLADAMEAVDPRYRAMVWVGCYCGPRIGELIALRWSDFNFVKGTVSINKTTTEVRGKLADGPTKTKAGRREVPVPPRVIKELQRHRELFPGGPNDRVFTAKEGGPIRVNQLRRRAWAHATVRAGLAERTMVDRTDPKTGAVLLDGRGTGKARQRPVVEGMTFHDMRHTAVAMWIEIGSNDLQVAKWAGHRSVSFTKDRYGHLFSTDPAAAMARLDALIAEAEAQPVAKVIGLGSRNSGSNPGPVAGPGSGSEGPHPL